MTVNQIECSRNWIDLEKNALQHRIEEGVLGVTGGFSESDTDRLTGKMTGKVW